MLWEGKARIWSSANVFGNVLIICDMFELQVRHRKLARQEERVAFRAWEIGGKKRSYWQRKASANEGISEGEREDQQRRTRETIGVIDIVSAWNTKEGQKRAILGRIESQQF